MPRTAEFDREAFAALLAKQHGVIARGQMPPAESAKGP
jgi:hypothetical protein